MPDVGMLLLLLGLLTMSISPSSFDVLCGFSCGLWPGPSVGDWWIGSSGDFSLGCISMLLESIVEESVPDDEDADEDVPLIPALLLLDTDET